MARGLTASVPMSGLDCPEDYEGEWVPPRYLSHSPYDFGRAYLDGLRAAVRGDALFDRYWSEMMDRHAKFRALSDAETAKARALLAQGKRWTCPRSINAAYQRVAKYARKLIRIWGDPRRCRL